MKSRLLALAMLAFGGSLAVVCGTAPPVQAQTLADQEQVAEAARARLLTLPATPAVPHLDPVKVTDAMSKTDYRDFTFVIAHRGSHSAPEMTEHAPAGIHAAYAAGADGIELDVKATLDGDVVLGHDLAIGRELASWDGAPPRTWTPFSDFPLVDPAYAKLTRWPFLIDKDADSPNNPNRTKSRMSKIWLMPLRDTFDRQVADTQMTLYEALYLIHRYYPMQIWLDVKDLADLHRVGPVIQQARSRLCPGGVCADGPLKNICLKLSWNTVKQLVDAQGVFVGPRVSLGNAPGIYYFLAFGTGDLDDMATHAVASTPAERVRKAVDAYCSIPLGCLGGEPAHKYPGAPTQDIFDYLEQLRARPTGPVPQLASFHSVPQYDWYWSGLSDKARSLTYGRWYTRGDGSCCYSFNDTLNVSPGFGHEYQDLRPSYSWNETNYSTITTDEPLLVLRDLYRRGKRNLSLAQALLASGSSNIPSGGDTGTDVGSLPDGLYNLLTTSTRLPMGIVTGTLLIVESKNPSALWYVATRPGKKYTIVNPTTGQGLYNSNNAQLILKSPVDSDPRFLWEIAADGSWKSAGSSMSLYYGQGSRGAAVMLSPVGSPWSSTKLAAGVSERDPASSDSGPRGYMFCADEGGICQFTSRASVAFGANGSFRYSDVTGPFNCSRSPGDPDPAPGVVNACYVAPATNDPFPSQAYQATACAEESSSCIVARNQSLAFGAPTANGWRFTYRLFDEAGTVACTVEQFGFDPAPGVPKRCYASFFAGAVPPGPPGFALCAMRNETCSFVGTGAVAFGLAGRYTYKTATNGVPCTTASFGLDPAPGAIGPACFYRQTALPVLSYVKCANEDTECNSACTLPNNQAFRVIFGAKGRYVSRTFSGVGSVACCKSSFNNVDPIEREPKACYASRLDLVNCAAEDDNCSVPSGAVVLFGAPTNDEGKTWMYAAKRVLPGVYPCNTQTFGDPAPQKVRACFYQLLDMPQRGPETFTYCAPLNGTCQIGDVVAQVAFGVDGRYSYVPLQVGSFQCTKEGLKVQDPAPGSPKGCYYRLY